MSDVSLTAGMRSNLIQLQSTATLMDTTQTRLSSGRKVNSALDNPINFFTAQAHLNRAADLSSYKDGMSEAIQTIKSADAGISAITKLIQSAKAAAQSALKANTETGTETLTLSGVKSGDTITVGSSVFVATDSNTCTGPGQQVAFYVGDGTDNNLAALSLAAAINKAAGSSTIDASSVSGATIALAKSSVAIARDGASCIMTTTDVTVTAANQGTINENMGGNKIQTLTVNGVACDDTVTVGNLTLTATTCSVTATDTSNFFLIGINDDETAVNLGSRINRNKSTNYTSIEATKVTGSTITLAKTVSDCNMEAGDVKFTTKKLSEEMVGTGESRESYLEQYRTLMTQLDDLVIDSDYKGKNLLKSSTTLKVDFENNHYLNLEGFDASGTGLGIRQEGTTQKYGTGNWSTSGNIESDITAMDGALLSLRSQSTKLSSSLGVITTRQDFTTTMINELKKGADNLTLADMNEEGANMLMLQTRQQLGTNALSLSSQAAQSVLRLF